MLSRMTELLNEGVDFAFETTLATRSYVLFIQKAKELGYETVLVFFWLNSVELAKKRVNIRVLEGGHSIPPEIIERRYHRGLKYFFELYKYEVDRWSFIDNSGNDYSTLAYCTKGKEEVIHQEKWNEIKSKHEG